VAKETVTASWSQAHLNFDRASPRPTAILPLALSPFALSRLRIHPEFYLPITPTFQSDSRSSLTNRHPEPEHPKANENEHEQLIATSKKQL
jgi:hypothetical protein